MSKRAIVCLLVFLYIGKNRKKGGNKNETMFANSNCGFKSFVYVFAGDADSNGNFKSCEEWDYH